MARSMILIVNSVKLVSIVVNSQFTNNFTSLQNTEIVLA